MLLIIRGQPHTGKTQMAKAIQQGLYGWVHLESDMAFATSDGQCIVDINMINSARQWCLNKTKKLLADGYNVVVSDSLPELSDIQPYIMYCLDNGIHYQVLKLKSKDVPEKLKFERVLNYA